MKDDWKRVPASIDKAFSLFVFPQLPATIRFLNATSWDIKLSVQRKPKPRYQKNGTWGTLPCIVIDASTPNYFLGGRYFLSMEATTT